MNLPAWILVAMGGAAGALGRYGLSGWVQGRYPALGWPAGTALVNVLGCLLAGLLLGALERQAPASPARLLLITGFCGGFTTFSAFALENLNLLRNGQGVAAALYAGGSVVAGGLAAGLGWWLAARG